jgi:hypothetical protein
MSRSSAATTKKLKVGDKVVLRVAGRARYGVVIEDRGPLASNGSQIVAIEIGNDEDRRFEVRAEYLERVAA